MGELGKDSIGRTWQCGTIQLDFQLPQRFDIDYIGADGEKHRPIMLHRVVFGPTIIIYGTLSMRASRILYPSFSLLASNSTRISYSSRASSTFSA